MIRFFVNSIHPGFQSNWPGLIGFGIMSLLIGILIVLVPEILVAFIASLFLIIGIFSIFLGWKIRNIFKERQEIRIKINE